MERRSFALAATHRARQLDGQLTDVKIGLISYFGVIRSQVALFVSKWRICT